MCRAWLFLAGCLLLNLEVDDHVMSIGSAHGLSERDTEIFGGSMAVNWGTPKSVCIYS